MFPRERAGAKLFPQRKNRGDAMDHTKILRIKEAVRTNFDSSPDPYQSFEDRHGFFRKLSERLLSRMCLSDRPDVLDVGCGSGASCAQILDACPGCRVWGLDISSAMLDAARAKYPENNRLHFVEGDAANLPAYFDFSFDAIVYSASIFLIPDFQESLRQALDLLKEHGSLGLTFMDGLYDADGNHLFTQADERAKEGVSQKKPVNWSEFESFFAGIFPVHTSWNEDFRLEEDVLREFFSVPAMSAGLFPGVPFAERVRKAGRLFDLMPRTERIFRWRLMIGEKPGTPKASA
jgi:ubiquinone/menaquinone biosynthesis C-methylase UbiE